MYSTQKKHSQHTTSIDYYLRMVRTHGAAAVIRFLLAVIVRASAASADWR